MLSYIKKAIVRKKARRVTQIYPYRIDTFHLEGDGQVKFANWENPLIEPKEVRQSQVDFFRKFIRNGDLVIDIGANIGDTTVPMAIAAGKEGLTLGFDPNPYVYTILEANAKLNKDKTNIQPVLNAVSTKEEEFYFISSEATFANGGISPTKESIHGKYICPEKIKGVNLLDYLRGNHSEQLNKLSFIKIDTEGYDKEILKSIADLIKEYKPGLVAESFGKSSNEAKEELFHVISMHGYRLFYFEDFAMEAKTQEIKTAREMTLWKKTMNIYAVPVK